MAWHNSSISLISLITAGEISERVFLWNIDDEFEHWCSHQNFKFISINIRNNKVPFMEWNSYLFPFKTAWFHDCCFLSIDSLKSSSNKRLTKNPVLGWSSSSKILGIGFGSSDTSSHCSINDEKYSACKKNYNFWINVHMK